MTIREQVEARVKELNAKIIVYVDTDKRLEIGIEAPHKSNWRGLDLHEAIGCWDVRYEDMVHDDVWTRLLEDMEDGIEDCDIIDCDWCGYNAEAAAARGEYLKDDLTQ